jgi:ABC-type nitrate/sulfonate/bicarbonate transport system substrate-binding protein
MTLTMTTLKLAGGAQGFNWLPVFIADELGLFAQRGLQIEYLRMGTVDKATVAVLEGAADLAITPPEGAIANFLKGGELRVIASNSNRLPMSLVARQPIQSIAQLEGRRIGTSSLTEGTAIYTQMLLAREGLKYPGDYEFVICGVHTKRWDALQAGQIDCAPQPAPWNFLAEDAGYNRIGEVNEVIPEILFAAVVGKKSRLEVSSSAVDNFLQALAEANVITNDRAREDVALPIFQRITTPESPALALRGLRYMRDMGMWPQGLEIPAKALETSIDVMIRAGLLEESKRHLAGAVFDRSYLRGALGAPS